MLALAYLFPGADEQVALQHYFDKPAYEAARPPVDSGASGELTVSDSVGSARVFWTQPSSGKVKVTIEVPPGDGSAE
jgi:hypothetical protein